MQIGFFRRVRRTGLTVVAVLCAVATFARATSSAGPPGRGSLPPITHTPFPVIADDAPSTTHNLFVYPDAFGLDEIYPDPTDSLIFSYFSATGRYQLNGRQSLDPANPLDDPSNPGDKQLGAPLLDDPDSLDADTRTITFRDATLSPIGGANTDPAPGDPKPRVVAGEVVTFFISDGATFSMKNILVYTESNGRDRLSGGGVEVLDIVPSSDLGWRSAIVMAGGISATDQNGLCIQTPGPGDHFALWTSPYGIVDLVQNAVYRIRLTMDSDGSALPAGTTPFWDFVIDNFNDNQTAHHKYAAAFMNWDIDGSANSVGLSETTGRGTFEIWFTPPQMLAADWNDPATGEFTAAAEPENDMRFSFRVIDVGSLIDAELDAGKICLRNISVTRYDFDSLNPAGAPLYDADSITSATHIGRGLFFGAGRTTVSYAGGSVTIAPNTDGPAGGDAWDQEVVIFDPGNGIVAPAAEIVDNWPIKWESDELLRGTLTVQAPDAQSEATPPDAISLTWDSPGNELLLRTEVYATTSNKGMPKLAAPTDLVSFYYTNNKTLSPAAGAGEFDRIRMRVLLLLTPYINSGGSVDNLGGVVIHSQRIEEVSIP
jgi:hypothetical protein